MIDLTGECVDCDKIHYVIAFVFAYLVYHYIYLLLLFSLCLVGAEKRVSQILSSSWGFVRLSRPTSRCRASGRAPGYRQQSAHWPWITQQQYGNGGGGQRRALRFWYGGYITAMTRACHVTEGGGHVMWRGSRGTSQGAQNQCSSPLGTKKRPLWDKTLSDIRPL